jgi:amidase
VPSAGDGPFQGVPFVVKQLMADCAGTPTTLGSRFFAKQPVAAADSAAVARMRRAGLVIVGRTNTSEFGLAPTTEPAFGGATLNPWRKGLSPGGSSGGRRRSSRRAACRWRMRPTAAARSAFPARCAVCSA